MQKNLSYLKIPPGFEYFNLEKLKKFHFYKKKIQTYLEQKNMIEFIPPLIDYIDIFSLTSNSFTNGNSHFAEKIFEIKDSNGELLAIRSDITVMAMKSFLFQYPHIDKIQYFYLQPVYRDISKGTGFIREIYQVGVEWIGEFDNRILKLIEISKELLNFFPLQYTFVIGNAKFMNEFLSLFPKNLHKVILNAFYFKDSYKLKEIIKENKLTSPYKNFLLELPFIIGTSDIKKDLFDLFQDYPMILKTIKETIEPFREIPDIIYDFSLVREFNYYTGIIFEVYSNQNNTKILTGGIYDNFSLKFSNLQIPSSGFALNLSEFINIDEVIK